MSRTLPARSWLNGLRSTFSDPSQNSGLRSLPPGVVGIPSQAPRPIGGFRGALTGFAFGLAGASAFGFAYILQEYKVASQSMTKSVEELEQSTAKVTEAYARVSALEQHLARVEQSAGTKDELRRRTGDLVRVYDALHEDVYEVKRKLYDIERDTNRLLGTSSSRQANGRLV